MNKFTTIAAMALFGLMASAAQADDMASEDGMMKDDMKGSMEHNDMKNDKAMHDDMTDPGMGKASATN